MLEVKRGDELTNDAADDSDDGTRMGAVVRLVVTAATTSSATDDSRRTTSARNSSGTSLIAVVPGEPIESMSVELPGSRSRTSCLRSRRHGNRGRIAALSHPWMAVDTRTT